MTSSVKLVEMSGVIVSHVSDHYLVNATLKVKLPRPLVNLVRAKSYKNYNSHWFLNDLEQALCHSVYALNNTSEMLNQFNCMFLKIVRIQHHHCPFVNMEIKEIIGCRDTLLQRTHHTGLRVDWLLKRYSWKVVKTKLRQAEKEYIQKEQESCQNASSKLKVIRHCST